ncbi:hypothetical protein CPC08DRAFT_731225 [Agrocybe pediades]|nr:hypothetical protein CPC08DRAFT_731225 [Agrocybe pediades]
MPNMIRYAIRPFLNAVMVGTYTDNPIKFPGSIHGELTALVQFLVPSHRIITKNPKHFSNRFLRRIRLVPLIIQPFSSSFSRPIPSPIFLTPVRYVMDHKNRPKRTCRRPERYEEDREAAEEAARVQARRSVTRRRQQRRSSPVSPPAAPSIPPPPLPIVSAPPRFRPVYCGCRPQRVSTAAWNIHPQSAPFFQVLNGTWDTRVPVPLQGFMHPFLHGLYMYNLPCNNCLKRGEPCFLGWYEGATGFSCVACRIKWKKKCCKSEQIFPDIIWRRVRPSEHDISVGGTVFWYTLARTDNLYPEGYNLCHPPSERALPVEITLLGNVNPYLCEAGPYEDIDEEWEAWKRREDTSDSSSDDDDEDDEEDDGGDSPDEREGVAEGYEEASPEGYSPPVESSFPGSPFAPPIVNQEPLFLPDVDDDREIEEAWLKTVLAIDHEPLPLEVHQPRRLDLRTVQHPRRQRMQFYPQGYFTPPPPPPPPPLDITNEPSLAHQVVAAEQNAIAESILLAQECSCPSEHPDHILPTPPTSPLAPPQASHPQPLRRSARIRAVRPITPTPPLPSPAHPPMAPNPIAIPVAAPPVHRSEFVEGSSRQPLSYRRPPRINSPVPIEFQVKFEPLP